MVLLVCQQADVPVKQNRNATPLAAEGALAVGASQAQVVFDGVNFAGGVG
jgi:hypothetical protein